MKSERGERLGEERSQRWHTVAPPPTPPTHAHALSLSPFTSGDDVLLRPPVGEFHSFAFCSTFLRDSFIQGSVYIVVRADDVHAHVFLLFFLSPPPLPADRDAHYFAVLCKTFCVSPGGAARESRQGRSLA